MQRFFLRAWYGLLASCIILLIAAPLSAVVGAVVQRVAERQAILPAVVSAPRDTFLSIDSTPLTDVIAASTPARPTLASGVAHTCAVTYTGNVLCWGGNSHGELGLGIDGAARAAGYTADMVGALYAVQTITAGAQHTCALVQTSQSVWCWGANDALQLGQDRAGPGTDAATAQRIPLLSDITAIDAGRAHTCALRADGSVWCWGANAHGQTGDAGGAVATRIQQVPLAEPVVALTVGGDTSCAIGVSGVWSCWGAQIPGYTSDQPVPVATTFSPDTRIVISDTQFCVAATTGVTCWSGPAPDGFSPADTAGALHLRGFADGSVCAVFNDRLACWDASGSPTTIAAPGIVDSSGGDGFRCVSVRAGRVLCTGKNDVGQLATRGVAESTSYVTVEFGSSGASLSAGTAHVCGLWQLGSVRCWGRGYEGQLGSADTDGLRSSPDPVTPPLTAVRALATGAHHTCGLRVDGTVSCWGANDAGQIGVGDTIDHGVPLAVGDITDGMAISAGRAHTCVLTRDGAVWCWGANNAGQVGGTPVATTSPIRVPDLPPLLAIASGGDTNCGLQADGLVVCWGAQIGALASYQPFTALTDTTAVAVGESAVCALRVDGSVWCWGDLDGGGTSAAPTQVAALPPVRTLVVGQHHACAIDTTQQLWCWGSNRLGQVDPARQETVSTAPVRRGSYVAAVSAGAVMTCARTVNGGTDCWGDNSYGQLSDADFAVTNATVRAYDDGFAIATGGSFSCALLKYVMVRCWGSNEYGQLGDGTTTGSPLPQTVRSNEEAIVVAAGSAHACQIIIDGTVRCWGHNNFGQLGNESTEDSATPVVAAVQAAVALALGQSHSCALLQDGGGACWGKNDDGQLGSGNTASSGMPLRVAELTDAIAISSGGNHTCAVHQTGLVSCWGRNEQGQLGIGTTSPGLSIPAAVSGIADVVQLSAGNDHTCAVRGDSTVWCWGWNRYGQIGNSTVGEKTYITAPQQVTDLADAVAVRAGGNHTCVLRQTGAVRCWGDNYNGQLGVNHTVGSTYDAIGTDVPGLESAIQIAVGGAHTCALLQRGTVRCWGWNRDGQLGTGSQTPRSDVETPAAVVGQSSIRSLAIGDGHICDVDAVGTVWCWGANDTGQLGIGVMGDAGNFVLPNEVDAAVDTISVDLGAQHTCALLETAELNCWGHNQHGQLGNSFAGEIADSVVPNFVIGLTNVTAFSAGGDTSCAVSDGTVWCWGDNQYGQLGTATVGVGDFRMSATLVEGIDAVLDVTVGTHHVCALRTDQSVWCWGRNNVHQISAEETELSVSPLRVPLDTPITALSTAGDHTCALDRAGAIWCWGNNQSGQLGVVGEAVRTAQRVSDVPSFRHVATGQQHTCALTDAGATWCWGSNEHGQLGVPRTDVRTNLPPTLAAAAPPLAALAAGADRSCGRSAAGTVYCWGDNSSGTLGVVPNPDRHTPAVVDQLWTMRVAAVPALSRTPLPKVPTIAPTQTPIPTQTRIPTRTLIRVGSTP